MARPKRHYKLGRFLDVVRPVQRSSLSTLQPSPQPQCLRSAICKSSLTNCSFTFIRVRANTNSSSSSIDLVGASLDPGSRTGVQLLEIRTSFNDMLAQRLQRPRPTETVIAEKSTMHIPAQELLPLYRRKPKGGLRWLFGRNKATSKSNQKLATSLEDEETSTKPLVTSHTLESSQHRTPLSAHEPPVSSPLSTVSSTKLQNRTSKPTLKSMSNKDSLVKTLASWDPPELFKAYPQAVKHARLRAPTAQVKAILQLYEEKKLAGLEQDVEQNVALNHAKNKGARKKREKAKGFKHSTLEIASNDGWAEKVYVLATSGYLLEYACDGAFDRLPEKLMPLGRESAAFASDAISGEHWVLQVSRIANDEGIIPDEGPKSIFRKLGFGSDMRRSTSAFLLIFDSPEDMDSWLVAIRKEIEALGGRKYRPDDDCRSVAMRRTNDDIARQMQERPSRRFFIKREPNRFGDQIPEASFEGTTGKTHWIKAGDHESLTITGRRPSMVTQKSVDSPSVSNATVSSDQALLERLKETPRMSYVSAATKTLSTSRGSSPEPSPARAPFSPEDLIPQPAEDNSEISQISRPGSSMQQVSASMPTASQRHNVDVERGSGSPRGFSIARSRTSRASSPPMPNFRVSSFSKRYSCVTNPTLLSPSTSGFYTSDCGAPPQTVSNEHRKSPKQPSPKQPRLSAEEKSRLSKLGPQSSPPAISKSSGIYHNSDLLHSLTKSDDNTLRRKSDRLVSRRFSSLDYTRDVSSRDLESAKSSFPHPPPTTALPALPRHRLLPFSSENHIEDQRFSSGNAENIRKKRRPVSMQVHSDPTTRDRYRPPQIGLQHPSEIDEYSLSTPISTIPKPTRAPPPPPLSLVQAPEIRNHQRPCQATRPLSKDSLPGFSSLADIPSFLNLENSTLGSLEGPWNASYAGSLQNVRVK